jgi:hypothetical protein
MGNWFQGVLLGVLLASRVLYWFCDMAAFIWVGVKVGWFISIVVVLGAEIVPLLVFHLISFLLVLAFPSSEAGMYVVGFWYQCPSLVKLGFLILFVALALG